MTIPKKPDVTIIGVGLAGAECAWQLLAGGFSVHLIDCKPEVFGAYRLPGYAELVCSNSLKSDDPETAGGLLKREMRSLGSIVLDVADRQRLRAGGALAVDRERFSAAVTNRLTEHALITVESRKVDTIPVDTAFTVVATGPLTEPDLAAQIDSDHLHFFDATAPIVSAESINPDLSFAAGRYGKGGDDYINCPLNEAEYRTFYDALLNGRVVETTAYDDRVFAHCQPIERLAARGIDTIRYGPMRPTGLTDPKTGRRPYAVLQLRREDAAAQMWGLVGFQTRLTFPEQQRIFRLIPALAEAEFFRYGVMHRNTYVQGPRVLGGGNVLKQNSRIFAAGQLTGVEGYMESASSGLITGRFIRHLLEGKSRTMADRLLPAGDTMIGALHQYVISSESPDYQPMNANFGLFAPTPDTPARKAARKAFYGARSAASIQRMLEAEHA